MAQAPTAARRVAIEPAPDHGEDTRTSELDGYVQILVRPETLHVYAEAVDLDAQGTGSLSDSDRELLARLGWTRGGDSRE